MPKANRWRSAGVGAAALLGGALVARRILRESRHLALRGKTVIVTGGSRGLGLAISRELIRHGANLVICSRTADQVERAQLELAAAGGNVLAVPCDITNDADVEQFLQRVRHRFGKIDALINNAGVISVGPMEDATIADYELAMETHFWAAIKLSFAVLPEMRHRRSGRIVNIASFGGLIAAPHLLPYSASKFAMVGFSQGMRTELARSQIYVTTVCPGLIRTGSPRNVPFKGQREKEYAWFTFGDVMPMVSIDPARLAKKIVNAMVHGDAQVVAPWFMRIPVVMNAVSPSGTAALLDLMNRFLPASIGNTESQPVLCAGRSSFTGLGAA